MCGSGRAGRSLGADCDGNEQELVGGCVYMDRGAEVTVGGWDDRDL